MLGHMDVSVEIGTYDFVCMSKEGHGWDMEWTWIGHGLDMDWTWIGLPCK